MKIVDKFIAKTKDQIGSEPITMAFLGDSVTNGCFELYTTNEGGFDTYYNAKEVYHSKLANMLNMLYPKANLNIINAGISGDSATGGLKRIDRDVLKFHPDLVVVCFGLNDSNGGIDGISGYSKALDGIFSKINCECIFLTPNIMATQLDGEISMPSIMDTAKSIVNTQVSGIMDKYMDAAREVCIKHNVPICDCYAIWKRLNESGVDTTKLLANRLNHPNYNMHYLFAVELLKTIFN